MHIEELTHRIVFQNGGIFPLGILLLASAKINHSPLSEIEEVLVFHEFHRIGVNGMIKIDGDEVVQFTKAPIGTRVILNLGIGMATSEARETMKRRKDLKMVRECRSKRDSA